MAAPDVAKSIKNTSYNVPRNAEVTEEVCENPSMVGINGLGSSYDYTSLMKKYRDDFNQKWIAVKPSPHGGECAFKFEDLPLLGVGKFGNVHLTKERQTGRCFALKVLKKENVIDEKVVEKTIMERKVLASVDFPFLISIVFSMKDNDYLYLGLPFVGGGDLFNYHRRHMRFSEFVTRFYGAQILLALEYLHNIKCLYRDLKLENVLIDVNGYIKITDFGLAKFVEDRTLTLCGTPEYLAPEMLRLKPYGTSVDWWSFGVLMFELVAGYTPFARYSDNLVVMYSKICDGHYDIPSYFSQDLRDLVVKLLNVQHATRLGCCCNGCIDIKNHRFFRPMQWNALLGQKLMPPYRPRLTHPCDVVHFKRASKKTLKPPSRSSKDQFKEIFKNF